MHPSPTQIELLLRGMARGQEVEGHTEATWTGLLEASAASSRGKGVVLGDPGLGKSLLLRYLVS